MRTIRHTIDMRAAQQPENIYMPDEDLSGVTNEAVIVDKSGMEAPRGIQGEIMIRGDNVMKRYYKAPDNTTRTLEPDGWLYTGDLRTMDEDGFVFVTGRLKCREFLSREGGPAS